jgi:hypothetical protein
MNVTLDMWTKFGLRFGEGSITMPDWWFIESVIDKYNIKSVLEFGAGLSTLLLNDKGVEVTSLETMRWWINKLKEISPGINVILWKQKDSPDIKEKYDMCFVDGPMAFGSLGLSEFYSRETSTRIASERCNYLIIHDAGRKAEKMWQDKYVKDKFDGPLEGGHKSKCNLWIKKGLQ